MQDFTTFTRTTHSYMWFFLWIEVAYLCCYICYRYRYIFCLFDVPYGLLLASGKKFFVIRLSTFFRTHIFKV